MAVGTTSYPGAIDTAANLFVLRDASDTFLTAAIGATDTTIPVDSTADLPVAPAAITIEGEHVIYTGATATTLTGCARGQFQADGGTPGTAHDSGTVVEVRMIAAHLRVLKDTLIAIETLLGAGGANVAALGGGGGGGGTGNVTGQAVSVDSELALFSGTTGKVVKRATGSGIAKLTSGVLGTAAQGTDYYAPAGNDVAVADGGTGASDATTARANLGVAATAHTHGAADIASGTFAAARLGSGTPDSATFLRGDQTWAAPASTGIANIFWAADYATVEAAVAAANAAVAGGAAGAVVNVGPGLWMTEGIDVASKVHIVGAGSQITTIKLNNTKNRAVIRGPSTFSSLTGTAKASPETRGANHVQIKGVTIEGNKANQSSGRGIELWGKNPQFVDVVVQNCKNEGIWTEFTNHESFADPPNDTIEGFFHRIKTINNGGDGWRMAGPHDSTMTDFVSFSNTGWGLKILTAGGGSVAGMSIHGINTFLNLGGSVYLGGDTIYLGPGIISGDRGNGIEIASGAGDIQMFGLVISGHMNGLLLRGANHKFSGVIQQSIDFFTTGTPGRGLVIDGCTACTVDMSGDTNDVAIRYISENGPNVFRARMNVAAAKVLIEGTPVDDNYTDWDVISTGGAGNLYKIRAPARPWILPSYAVIAGDGYFSDSPYVMSGYGAPESAVNAPRGSIYMVCGGGGGAVYRKTTALGTLTGWVAM